MQNGPHLQKLLGYQKTTKCWGSFLLCLGYMLCLFATIAIASDVFTFMLKDNFDTIAWYDYDGTYKSIYLNPWMLGGILACDLLFKGIFPCLQGRRTILVFTSIAQQPALTDDSLHGGSHPIQPKAKKMKKHKKQVWNLMYMSLITVAASLYIVRLLVVDVTNQMIAQEFNIMRAAGSTKIEFSISTQMWMFNMEEEWDVQGQHPFVPVPHDQQHAKVIFKNLNLTEGDSKNSFYMPKNKQDMKKFQEDMEKWGEEFQEWAVQIQEDNEDFEPGLNKTNVVSIDLKGMTEAQMKNSITFFINVTVSAVAVWSLVSILMFFGFYVCFIRQSLKGQKKLEEFYLMNSSYALDQEVGFKLEKRVARAQLQ